MVASARRARRTNVQVTAAITTAVLDELREVGFAGLTFESVARRAELSKAVLYRRHPTRVSLALAGLAFWTAYGQVNWRLAGLLVPAAMVVVGIGVLMLSRRHH